ncbi:MAG: MerR family transcriptional regulator [Nitrospirales bacterium]
MNTHRIQRVARLTGLSKDVIRVWERRYGIVQPTRGANRYRLYTDEDVVLLRYLKAEVETGQSIGQLVAAGHDELLSRAKKIDLTMVRSPTPYAGLIGELTTALSPLDRELFERRLNGAVAVIPFEDALHKILLPLQERVGQLWHDGRLGVAVEHYVTKHVQQKMFAAMNQLPMHEYGPPVVVACPSDEQHEIAAQAVAYLCSARGCRVSYLGPNLPIAELAAFCQLVEPKLILLSLTTVPTSDQAEEFVKELGMQLPNQAVVIVGGAAAQAEMPLFAQAHIAVLDNLFELDRRLAPLVTSSRSRR